MFGDVHLEGSQSIAPFSPTKYFGSIKREDIREIKLVSLDIPKGWFGGCGLDGSSHTEPQNWVDLPT